MSSSAWSRVSLPRSALAGPLLGPPLRDLQFLVLLLPVWWALGIEQFVPPVLLTWSVLKLAAARRRLAFTPTAVCMAALLIAMLASSLFIVDDGRYVSFARSFSVHLTALWVWLIVTTAVRDWRDVARLLRVVALAMAAAGVLGALGFLGIAELRFESPVGVLLPESLRATDYGSVVAVRSTGQRSWFAGLQSYYRTNSIFLFSTMYAAALALTIPVVAFLREVARGWARTGWTLLALLLAANLLFTTGRVAVIACVAGAAVYLAVRTGLRTRAMLAALGFALLAVLAVTTPASDAGETLEAAVLARGPGSLNARLQIYRETVAGIERRPLLGWGSERDIEGLRYPAGSHSLYLGMLYRHGLIGLALFVAMLVATWRSSRPLAGTARGHAIGPPERFLLYGRWVFTALLVVGITTVPDVDATLYLIAWTLLAALVATRRLLDRADAASDNPGGETAQRPPPHLPAP